MTALSAVHARRRRDVLEPQEQEVPSKRARTSESPEPLVTEARAFSPSRRADSVGAQDITLTEVFGTTYPLAFESRLGQNTFILSSDEALGLPNIYKDDRTVLLIALNPGERVFLRGAAELAVLSGALEFMGVELTAPSQWHRIFAPSSHPIPSITATVGSILTSVHRLPERVLASLQTEVTLVALTEDVSGIVRLGDISPHLRGLFISHGPSNSRVPGLQIEDVSAIRDPLLTPQSWRDAIRASLHHLSLQDRERFIGLVHGPKGAGKSTFARALVNTLTSRGEQVAFLDCDLGQSEFCPPGFVSLHLISNPVFGPPFTHFAKPHRAHFIGSSSPKSNPTDYLSAIHSLIDSFLTDIQFSNQHRSNGQDVPLIINTQGWQKGLGADLLTKISGMARPNHLYSFEIKNSSPRFDKDDSAVHHELETVSGGSSPIRLAASDLRGLSTMSYFHSSLSASSGLPFWSFAVPLGAQQPWEFECAKALDSIVLCGPDGNDVKSEDLEYALPGSLVGLVTVNGQFEPKTSDGFPYAQGQSIPSRLASECLGLALVRFASNSPAILHLLSPIPVHDLMQCRVLIKGDLEFPVWGMLDYGPLTSTPDEAPDTLFGVELSRVPLLHWSSRTAVGGFKRRPRRNIMRRGQM